MCSSDLDASEFSGEALVDDAETGHAEDEHGPPRSGHLLLVEDNPVNQEVVRSMLERAGYTVIIAENGKEAVGSTLATAYDAILMDLHMPVMDGFAATREIRELEKQGNRRLPIIALTANALPETRELCLKAGMDDYLTKPVRQIGRAHV